LRKRLTTAGGLLVAVLALASCGGNGEREALAEMIDAAIVETGPESCLKFNTLHLLESTTDLEGEAAVKACEESALDLLTEQPTKIEASEIDVEGDSGTALLAFTGSIFDGQQLRYAFVEREDRWKFNEILGFVDLDAAHLVLRAGRDGMLRAETRQEAENVACWIGRMERMSDRALEELLLGDDSTASSDCIAESRAV
jgi:hypothetical protein